jgi:putative transposase
MASETDVSLFAALRDAEGTGRPLGSDEFVKELERLTGRRLPRQKPGRKPNEHHAQLELGIEAMSKVSL